MSQSQKPSDGLLARVRERRRARRQQALERQHHQCEQLESQGIDGANKTAGYVAAYGAEGSAITAGLDGEGGGGA